MLDEFLARTRGALLHVNTEHLNGHPKLRKRSNATIKYELFERLSCPEILRRSDTISYPWSRVGPEHGLDANYWSVRLSQQEFPQLSYLQIRLPLYSPPVGFFAAHGLQTLILHGDSSTTKGVIDVDNLLDIMAGAPRLLILELRHALSGDITRGASKGPSGVQCQLRVLRLSTRDETCLLALARHISVQKGGEVQIIINDVLSIADTFDVYTTLSHIERREHSEVRISTRGISLDRQADIYTVYIKFEAHPQSSLNISRPRSSRSTWTWQECGRLLSDATCCLTLGDFPYDRPLFHRTNHGESPLYDLTEFLRQMYHLRSLSVCAKDVIAGALDLLPGETPKKIVVTAGPSGVCFEKMRTWLNQQQSASGPGAVRPVVVLCHAVIQRRDQRELGALTRYCSEIHDQRVFPVVHVIR
ncbi:unnamed protein product [Peniophora sp. CBMAI 1063]|nr:unnamed protein product [Peniophora sp. CBMAI 1063]